MSDFHFLVVPYESCVEEVIAFRNANRVLARDRRYFEWRYEHRPCRQKALIVWGIDSQDRKVAAVSIIPRDFHVLDGVYPVGLLGDISVAPACRGRGVATQMLLYLQQHPAFQALRACIVLPNDEAFHPLERAGLNSVTTLARLVKLIDVGPRLQKRLGSRWQRGGLARTINFLVRFFSGDGWLPHRGPYRAAEVSEFDPSFDVLWREISKHGKILAVRNRDYLNWRYREHPTVAYRIFAVYEAQQLRGYIVFHVASDVAVVDDFLAAETASGTWMIQDFVEHVRRNRLAANIHVRYNINSFLALPWKRFGFMRRRDFQRVMVGEPPTDRPPLHGSDESWWFVTAGDKDV